MSTHTVNGIKVHTSHVCPPIPVRTMDWSAVTTDYDADCDQYGFHSSHPIGWGGTEQEAIDDLLEQINE